MARSWKKLFQGFLLSLVTLGIFLMVFAAGYIWWVEYERKKQDDFLAHLWPDTHWVESKFPVYFILGAAMGKINLDGTDLHFIYEGESPIQQFIFSPNGRHILIVTRTELIHYDQKSGHSRVIDSLGSLIKDYGARGSIQAVQWAPDSQGFCYELYRWSPYSSLDQFYFYSLKDRQKRMIKIPAHNVTSLFWDKSAENLYYYQTEVVQSSSKQSPHKVKIYRIPLASLEPQVVASFLSKSDALKDSDFKSWGINPYFRGNQSISNRVGEKNLLWISEQKTRLGLDEKDYLYFVNLKGPPKRIFRIRKRPLPLMHLRWAPEGRYVVLTHSSLGILVFDPRWGRLAKLIDGQAFGWYEKNK